MPRTSTLPLDVGDLAERLARSVPTVESALLDGLGPAPPFLLDAEDAAAGGADGAAAAAALWRAVALRVAPPITDGRAARAAAAAAAALPLPLSIPGLDALMSGGLRRGWLTELSGPAGAGKTQACLAAAAGVAGGGGAVLFLHTGGAFPAGRLAELVRARLGGEGLMREALGRVAVVGVASLAEAGRALEAAAAAAAAAEGRGGGGPAAPAAAPPPPPSLIVLDSLAAAAGPALLRTADGPTAAHGRACLAALAHQVKALAAASGAAALVTTGASEGGPAAALPGGAPAWRPGLGEGWAPAPHVRVLLLPPPGGGGGGAAAHTSAAAPRPPRLAHLLVGPPPKGGSVAAWRVPGEE